LLPAFDSSEDAERIGPPDEWLRLFIVFDEEPIDGGLQVGNRAEDAALYTAFGSLSNASSD